MLSTVPPDTTVPVPAWPPVGSPLEVLLTQMTVDLVIWFQIDGDTKKAFTSLKGTFDTPSGLDLSFAGLLHGAFTAEDSFLHVLSGSRIALDATVPTDKFGFMRFRVYIDWHAPSLTVARDTRKPSSDGSDPTS